MLGCSLNGSISLDKQTAGYISPHEIGHEFSCFVRYEKLKIAKPGFWIGLDYELDYELMIIRSNSASVQCFLCDFQLSRYHAICDKCLSVERIHGSTQTGKDYSNTKVNSQ